MSHYKHLTILEREMLVEMKATGTSIREIARQLQRSPSTISRELRRGRCGKHPYRPSTAQARYQKRRKNCGRKRVLLDTQKREIIRHYIQDCQWSPEQIEHRFKLENGPFQISYATIYRSIYAGLFEAVRNVTKWYHKKKVKFSAYLRKKGKKRKKNNVEQRRGKFTIEHHIDERPAAANERTEIGHLETDTVAGIKGGACVVTIVDRRSRYLFAEKISRKCAKETNAAIEHQLIPFAEHMKSMTPDRGAEFARYKELDAALCQMTVYFPPPHAPWERGTNENTNGLLREYLPKSKDIRPIPDELIAEYVDRLNHRPRKCLGWRTPHEVFFQTVLHLT